MKKYGFLLIISIVLALVAIPVYGYFSGSEDPFELQGDSVLTDENNPFLQKTQEATTEESSNDGEFVNPFLKDVQPLPNAKEDEYQVEQIPNAKEEDFKIEPIPNAELEFDNTINLPTSEDEKNAEEGFKEVDNSGVKY